MYVPRHNIMPTQNDKITHLQLKGIHLKICFNWQSFPCLLNKKSSRIKLCMRL